MSNLVQYGVGDMERMARAFAASKLFGVQNPEQALALCLIAQAEGRHPASAAADYHIMNGKPAKKAEAMLRDFLAGGGKVEWHELSDTKADATFSHPAGGSARIDWTLERAKKAQLTTAMWSKYPRQMLRSRCVSEGVRTVYPMATSGLYEVGEVEDFAGPAVEPQRAPLAAVADMRDVTPPREPDAAEDAPPRRFNANQCKTVEVTLPDGEIITKGKLAARLGNEIPDIQSMAEAAAFRTRWCDEVETWPPAWELALWERLAIHVDELSALADKLAEADDEAIFPGDRDLSVAGDDVSSDRRAAA